MNKVKDRLLLIVTGLLGAALSLLFFRFTQEIGLAIISTMGYVVLWLDNNNLRAKIKRLEQQLRECS